MLGIGIVTYNRLEKLKSTIEKVQALTTGEYALAVADDGSTDGTIEYLDSISVACITGANSGVCWNKNRALFYLFQIKRCDQVLLLEDDTSPIDRGWQADWISAADAWGHVNLAGPWFKSVYISGKGTVEDPFIAPVWSGQCTGFSAEAFSYVGYLDTRFKGFGYGHGEHSRRFMKLGFGGTHFSIGKQEHYRCKLLDSNLAVARDHTFENKEELAKNREVLTSIQGDQVYRHAWRTDAEMQKLRDEVSMTRKSPSGTGRDAETDLSAEGCET